MSRALVAIVPVAGRRTTVANGENSRISLGSSGERNPLMSCVRYTSLGPSPDGVASVSGAGIGGIDSAGLVGRFKRSVAPFSNACCKSVVRRPQRSRRAGEPCDPNWTLWPPLLPPGRRVTAQPRAAPSHAALTITLAIRQWIHRQRDFFGIVADVTSPVPYCCCPRKSSKLFSAADSSSQVSERP